MYKCKCGGTQFKATAVITADAAITTKAGVPELIAGTQDIKDMRFTGLFTCVQCGEKRLSVDEPDSSSDSVKRCACGNTYFTAHQVCRHDVIVNTDNTFEKDDGIYDAEHPYGPYCCTECGAEVEDLSELKACPTNTEAEPSSVILDATPDANPIQSERRAEEPVFAPHQINGKPQIALHLDWAYMDVRVTELLRDILGREVSAEACREEYYYWRISFAEPITPDELDIILNLAEADEVDREISRNEEEPQIWELTESVCNKLIGKIVPFSLSETRADDEGVWFIGEERDCVPGGNRITLPLSNGMVLSAKVNNDPNYPSINTTLRMPGGSENCICFAELNTSRPEGRQICVCAYAHNTDEPTYYASYHDDGKPCEDV